MGKSPTGAVEAAQSALSRIPVRKVIVSVPLALSSALPARASNLFT